MNKFGFKNRVFLAYAAMTVVVVVLFSIALILMLRTSNRETELFHQQELYKGNLTELRGVLEQMNRLALQITSNNEIMNRFIGLDADESEGNYFASNLIDAIEIGSLLDSINGTDNFAARISIFNQRGDYISTGTLFEDAERIEEVLASADFDDLIRQISQSAEETLLVSFHEDLWTDNDDVRLISLYKTLASYTSTVYGIVDIQVSAHALDQQAFWSAGQGEYYLMDSAGKIIYPFEENPRLEGIGALIQENIREGVSTFETELEGERVILLASKVYPSDWILLREIPAALLQEPYQFSYLIIILASMGLLILLMMVVNYLSARLTRPLGRLTSAIGNVHLQNMHEAIRETETEYFVSEFNALNAAFRGMLHRLDTSVAVELQANMRALQSQMNPHFLYNMLSVIVESSEEEGAERTVAMCMKLSAMLRYIADYNGDNATLEDEIAHTRNYLDLMKERYEELFTYEIIAPEGLGEIVVPKMIVQPLAENCFSHGFRDCRPPWRVRIDVRVTAGRWTLRVADNGSGMSEETMRDIYARFEEYRADVSTSYATLKLGGMGLINTLMRLSLYCGDSYVFTIERGPEGGSVIEIGGRA